MPGLHITDHQMRLYMSYRQTHETAVAAAKAGFSTATGYRMIAMKDKPPRGWLMLVCIETGKEIDCGVKYTQDDLEYAKPAKLLLQCRYCGKTHIFKFSDARLKQIRH